MEWNGDDKVLQMRINAGTQAWLFLSVCVNTMCVCVFPSCCSGKGMGGMRGGKWGSMRHLFYLGK